MREDNLPMFSENKEAVLLQNCTSLLFLLGFEGEAARQSHRFQSWGQSYLLLSTGACQWQRYQHLSIDKLSFDWSKTHSHICLHRLANHNCWLTLIFKMFYVRQSWVLHFNTTVIAIFFLSNPWWSGLVIICVIKYNSLIDDESFSIFFFFFHGTLF